MNTSRRTKMAVAIALAASGLVAAQAHATIQTEMLTWTLNNATGTYTATASNGHVITATISAYSDNGAGGNLQSATLDMSGSNLRIESQAEGSSPGQPNHAADSEGQIEGFYVKFTKNGSAIDIAATSLGIGWAQQRDWYDRRDGTGYLDGWQNTDDSADVNVLAWTKADPANLSLTWGQIYTPANGWTLLTNGGGAPTLNEVDDDAAQPTALPNPIPTASASWLITTPVATRVYTYTSSSGATKTYDVTQYNYVKLTSLGGKYSYDDGNGGGGGSVPAPATLALLAVGLPLIRLGRGSIR